jgi:hypothetical protein
MSNGEKPKGTRGPTMPGLFTPGLPHSQPPEKRKGIAMSNVIPFQPKASVLTTATTTESDGSLESRPAFSFDMIQTETRGMVLIEACVPATIATEFLRSLISFRDAAAAQPVL